MISPTEKYQSPKELASELDVHYETILAAIRDGRLYAKDFSSPTSKRSHYRISPLAKQEYLQSISTGGRVIMQTRSKPAAQFDNLPSLHDLGVPKAK